MKRPFIAPCVATGMNVGSAVSASGLVEDRKVPDEARHSIETSSLRANTIRETRAWKTWISAKRSRRAC